MELAGRERSMHRADEDQVTDSFASAGITRRTGRYRHVVFADAIDGAERAINLAPTGQPEADDTIGVGASDFLHWLFQQAGLDARNYRVETLARRLPACLRKLRVSHVNAAQPLLLERPQLLPEVLSTLLIGVTGFFRDAPVFHEIANRVLPDLCQRERPLRIWSAACSDGSELYSVGMLLSEMNSLTRAELLGTDCRSDAIRAAVRGLYELSAIRGVAPALLARYFNRLDRSDDLSDNRRLTDRVPLWSITPSIRARARWRTADLMTTLEPGPWDMILFRNAAMYLRAQSAASLWERLSNAVAPGGYLVLGKAEKPVGALGLSSIGHCLYRRSH